MKYVLLILLLSGYLQVQAQPAYRIQFTIADLNQPVTVKLGYFYLGNAYLLDSVALDSSHQVAIFNGKKALKNGLYYLYTDRRATVDFVVNNETDFVFSTNFAALEDSFTVKKSLENIPYWQWKKQIKNLQIQKEQRKSTFEMIQKATRDEDVLKEYGQKIIDTEFAIDSFSRAQPQQYPAMFFSKMINSTLQPFVPESISLYTENNAINPEYVLYYKDHFWDNYDFSDQRLLYSDVLPHRIKDWLSVHNQNMDSVKAGIDQLLRHAQKHTTSYQATLQWLTATFDNLQLYNADAVMVHLFDHYYPTATAAGIDTASWMRLEYKAKLFRPNLLGNIAPDFILPNQTDSLITLSTFKSKYTVLYFFSPLCTHCAAITPKYYTLLQQYAPKGLKVIAITTGTPKEPWQPYVLENLPTWTCVIEERSQNKISDLYAVNNLPNLYFLDENKKIIGKRIPEDQVENFLNKWIKE